MGRREDRRRGGEGVVETSGSSWRRAGRCEDKRDVVEMEGKKRGGNRPTCL